MRPGSVVLALFPQSDGQRKKRPALVLCEMPKYSDSPLCGISTRLEQFVEGFDEIVSPRDEDFVKSGLVKSSLFRLGFLTVLPDTEIEGIIGMVSDERRRRLLDNRSRYLQNISKAIG
jgi:mRNA interferase MazF